MEKLRLRLRPSQVKSSVAFLQVDVSLFSFLWSHALTNNIYHLLLDPSLESVVPTDWSHYWSWVLGINGFSMLHFLILDLYYNDAFLLDLYSYVCEHYNDILAWKPKLWINFKTCAFLPTDPGQWNVCIDCNAGGRCTLYWKYVDAILSCFPRYLVDGSCFRQYCSCWRYVTFSNPI